MTLLDEERKILVRLFLEKAEKAVAECAEIVKISPNVAVTRAYYAMYYAAQAMLRANGMSARTHEGTNSMFAEKFVKTGLFPRESYRNFGKLETDRYAADYNPKVEFTEEEASLRLKSADGFVKDVKKILEVDS